MRRDEFGDLTAFLTVAEERSFTRAAARLSTSQSALSLTLRRLETRLGVPTAYAHHPQRRAPTNAGDRLLGALGPAIDDIEASARNACLSSAKSRRAPPVSQPASTQSTPCFGRRFPNFLRNYPDIKVELNAKSALTDIVAERFDAGVRLGEQVEKDMVAVRIGPNAHMIVVAAPACFANRPPPTSPRDLPRYPCINLRLVRRWAEITPGSFEKNGEAIRVRVDGQFAFNIVPLYARRRGSGLWTCLSA